jgi:hypothetical protein
VFDIEEMDMFCLFSENGLYKEKLEISNLHFFLGSRVFKHGRRLQHWYSTTITIRAKSDPHLVSRAAKQNDLPRPCCAPKNQKHTTGGIPRWSPTLVLVARFSAYVWQSGRDAQFSLTYGRMCQLTKTLPIHNFESSEPAVKIWSNS